MLVLCAFVTAQGGAKNISQANDTSKTSSRNSKHSFLQEPATGAI
jgi:hypothetical protein